MDPLVLALTYLILLRYAEVKFPPLCVGWAHFPTQELWDLHHVLSLHMHQDVLAVLFTFASAAHAFATPLGSHETILC